MSVDPVPVISPPDHDPAMRRGGFAFALALSVTVLLLSASVTADTEDDGAVSDPMVYSINYHTNGGEIPDGYADRYVSGTYMKLPIPKLEGKYFAGWCTESALTNPMGGITERTRGHLNLYAKWIDGDISGTGWTMDVKGSYHSSSVLHTVAGTVDLGYESVLGDSVLFRERNHITYSWPDGSSLDDSDSASWTGRITDGWRFVRSEPFDDRRVSVWESDGDTMWLEDELIPVKIVSTFPGGKITQTTVSVYGFSPQKHFYPDVSAEYPISVGPVGKTRVGDDLTLTANGPDFEGWYLNGRPVSTSRTFTFLHPSPTDSIAARTSHGFTVVESGTDVNGLGFHGAVFHDDDGNRLNGLRDLDAGLYHGSIKRDGVRITIDFVVEERRTFSLEWEFEGVSYGISAEMLFSDMYAHTYDNPHLPRFSQRTQAFVETFYTPDEPALKEIHSALEGYGKDMDRVQYAEFVLRFVQTVPYLLDEDTRDDDEFWKFPIETLWDGGGDCEDTTFLYGTLMGMSGYRTAFLLFKDHAMPAIDLDAPGYVSSIDGYGFLLCETVSTAFSIGESTADHHPEDTIFSCRIESIR